MSKRNRLQAGKILEVQYGDDFDFNTEKDLRTLYLAFWPAGSGPLGCMATICALVEFIAYEKGFDPKTWFSDELKEVLE